MNDDQLKALRESLRISETEAIAIIDEALSRGAQRDGMATELERKSKDLRAWEIDARTAQARLRELEAGTTLTQAQTDVVAKAMRESQAALAMVTQERDAARAVTAEVQGAFGLAKSNARAVAFEEAARKVESTVLVWNGYEWGDSRAVAAASIRALSSTLPSGQWVAADVMERARRHLRGALMVPDPRKSTPQHAYRQEVFMRLNDAILNALSALESEASR